MILIFQVSIKTLKYMWFIYFPKPLIQLHYLFFIKTVKVSKMYYLKLYILHFVFNSVCLFDSKCNLFSY